MGKSMRRGWGIAAAIAVILFLLGVGITIVGNWATSHQPAWLNSLLDKHLQGVWVGLGGLAVVGALLTIIAIRSASRSSDLGTVEEVTTAGSHGIAINKISKNRAPVTITTVHSVSTLDQAEEGIPSLESIVEIGPDGDLVRVQDLNPYLLGATKTRYGDAGNHGRADPYVPRTRNRVDDRLQTALASGRLVVILGVSKAGKTRTAYEAIKKFRPDARLAAPSPSNLPKLIEHPRLQESDDVVVVWLDDLEDYLGAESPFTPVLLNRLTRRPGETVVIATLREEAYRRLAAPPFNELNRDVRLLLEAAEEIELHPTDQDRVEHLAAMQLYPAEDLDGIGLAEKLAGARALLRRYRQTAVIAPIEHVLVQVAIDWVRVGLKRPITDDELVNLASATLKSRQPLTSRDPSLIMEAVRVVREPLAGEGRVAALVPELLGDDTMAYRPFDYLVAADDQRLITTEFWSAAVAAADLGEVQEIGLTAFRRGEVDRAITIMTTAADAGHLGATNSLALLLLQLDPPDVAAARARLEQAATAGSHVAMHNLGLLLMDLEPPELASARTWMERAANEGDAASMHNLAVLLSQLDPPDHAAAREWYERAAEAGQADSMINLGVLQAGLDPPDLDGARSWLERAAATGSRRALERLIGFLTSDLNPPDVASALSWLGRAAEAGDSDAMFELSNALLREVDPPPFAQAHHWLEMAAAAAHPQALLKLGRLLHHDNVPEGRELIEIAATLGSTDAMYEVSRLLIYNENPDLQAGISWMKKAAEAGDLNAMCAMSELLELHLHPPDLKNGRLWLERAAEGGHPVAMFNLGSRLRKEVPAAARSWLRKSAEAGYLDAMFNLAYLLRNEADPPDVDGAQSWYQKAAESGHVGAMLNLAILLLDDLDPPDPTSGRLWLERAAARGNVGAMNNLAYQLEMLDPPDLAGARFWRERVADVGDSDD